MVLKQLSLAIQESQKTKPDYTHFLLIGSLHLWLQNLHLSLLGIERFSIEGGHSQNHWADVCCHLTKTLSLFKTT